jgi:hypothetical protein
MANEAGPRLEELLRQGVPAAGPLKPGPIIPAWALLRGTVGMGIRAIFNQLDKLLRFK